MSRWIPSERISRFVLIWLLAACGARDGLQQQLGQVG